MHRTTDREEFRAVASDAEPGDRVPVVARVVVDDPFVAYRRARTGTGGSFLETTGGQSGWSYFAVDPVERLQVGPDAVVADRDAATGERADYRRSTPSLEAINGLLSGESLVRGSCPVPYPCCAIGWLSYDIARELEDLPGSAVDDRGLPRVQLAVYETVASWEEPREGAVELWLTSCPKIPPEAVETGDHGIVEDEDAEPGHVEDEDAEPGHVDDRDADQALLDDVYDGAVDRLRAFADRIQNGDPAVGDPPASGPAAEFESDCGREAFADRVREVKQSVRDGDTFQANISQRLVAPAAVHPVDAFDAVRRVNPAPYSGLLEFDWQGRGVDLVSASPELLLSREGTRLVTEPIAGTRPRGDTDEEDEWFESELVTDEKERAEHAMLVDLERNDLGKVCAFGTVEVSEYRRVDRYSAVMHLVSLVEGEARPDVTLADAIAACFPGGTITGAPKPRTMEIIDELEATQRGPYTGSMAIFGFDGRATLNIVIRTLVRHRDEYHLRVGAGIVHDSIPDAEYDETLAKAKALLTAIDEALTNGEMRVGTEGADD